MKTFILPLMMALLVVTTASSQNRDSSDFYLQKANAARAERRIQLALNLYEKAAQWDTTHVAVLEAMGAYGLETRNFRIAVDAYTRWNRLEPSNAQIFNKLANLYFNLGRYADALRYAQQWEQLHSDKPLHYLSGMCYYYLENYPYAINRLLYAAEQDSANAMLQYLSLIHI